MNLADIYYHLKDDIAIIEEELERSIQSQEKTLNEAYVHTLKAGGKRIRPVFVLLGGMFGDYDIHSLKNIAVPLELIHMGSLVHDDVIDDAEIRRGKSTIKSKWDNLVAMYTGDYIFAKAIEISSYFNNPEVHRILSYAMVEMCIGEVEQIREQYSLNQNLRTYLRRIKRKTALLIAISCQLGAVCAKAPKNVQKMLFRFGYYVGMSFQITDDILDFVATEEELGKPAGSDLLQGNITLPALYTIATNEEARRTIKEMFASPFITEEEMRPILEMVKNSGGIEFSTSVSDKYLQKAYKQLEMLPDNPAKYYLQKIAEYIGKRKY